MAEQKQELVLDEATTNELKKDLTEFSKNIKTRIEELREVISEAVELRDDSNGLVFKASSNKYDTLQLTNFALQYFDSMKQSKLNKVPLGVG